MTAPISFLAKLEAPAKPCDRGGWCFLVLPREASEPLPRRGRTSVSGTLNGTAFQATLEPDGRLSHWLMVDAALAESAGVKAGDVATMEITPLSEEPDPELPEDFREALDANPDALETWQATTPIARVDWIHWMTTAKQAKTRAKRINDACSMLAEGKKRVCCFDPSGYYSKAFHAPKAAD